MHRKLPERKTKQKKHVTNLRPLKGQDFALKVRSLWPKLKKSAENAGYGPGDAGTFIAGIRAGINDREKERMRKK